MLDRLRFGVLRHPDDVFPRHSHIIAFPEGLANSATPPFEAGLRASNAKSAASSSAARLRPG